MVELGLDTAMSWVRSCRGPAMATHNGPVQLLELRLAVEADVDARDEGPKDLKHDGHVVEAHPQVPVVAGVAEQGVVER